MPSTVGPCPAANGQHYVWLDTSSRSTFEYQSHCLISFLTDKIRCLNPFDSFPSLSISAAVSSNVSIDFRRVVDKLNFGGFEKEGRRMLDVSGAVPCHRMYTYHETGPKRSKKKRYVAELERVAHVNGGN